MRFRALPVLVMTGILATHCVSAQEAPAQIPPSPSAAPQGPSQDVSDAEALMGKSDWKGAEAKLSAWLSAHPNDGRALFDAGYAADAQNQLDAAAGFYRRAVDADPKSFEAHLSLGLLLARQGKASDARPELVQATTLDPGDAGPALKARAWRALAQIDRNTNPSQASDELLEALKLTPETEDDTVLAAELAEAAREWDAAEAAYRRLLAKDPKSVDAQRGLAHVLIATRQYDKAETLLQDAIKQNPDDPALTAQLAGVLASENKPDEALPLLQKLHGVHPQDTTITRMLADVMAETGDAAGSDQLYVALLAKEPNDSGLLTAHGQNLIRQLQYAPAFEAFTKATESDPSNADAWSGLAFAASKTGRPSITLHALEMRSKYVPENPSTYFLRATSYDAVHDRAAAIKSYHEFLEAAAGKFPDQEWQARQRLLLLEKK